MPFRNGWCKIISKITRFRQKFLKFSGNFADKLPMLNTPDYNRIRVRAPTPSVHKNKTKLRFLPQLRFFILKMKIVERRNRNATYLK